MFGDELSIWNREFTESQVQELWNGGGALEIGNGVSNLLEYWDFESIVSGVQAGKLGAANFTLFDGAAATGGGKDIPSDASLSTTAIEIDGVERGESDLLAASDSYSLSFWVRSLVGNPTPHDFCWLEDAAQGNKTCLIRLHETEFNRMRVGTLDTPETVLGSGIWKHIVVSSKPDRQRLWVNGVLKINDETTFSPASVARRVKFGPWLATQKDRIDEVAVYGVELPEVAVRELYANDRGLHYSEL